MKHVILYKEKQMVESVNKVSAANYVAPAAKTERTSKNQPNKNIQMVDTGNLTPKQKEAVENLKKQIAAGNVEYIDTNFLEDILNYVIDDKSGDFIRISNFADPKKPLTFGEAKFILKLNLPPGSLKNNKTERGGGNFDKYDVPKYGGQYYLDIFIDDLTEATGLSKQDIKKLCGEK